jgi:hypothetical protein
VTLSCPDWGCLFIWVTDNKETKELRNKRWISSSLFRVVLKEKEMIHWSKWMNWNESDWGSSNHWVNLESAVVNWSSL